MMIIPFSVCQPNQEHPSSLSDISLPLPRVDQIFLRMLLSQILKLLVGFVINCIARKNYVEANRENATFVLRAAAWIALNLLEDIQIKSQWKTPRTSHRGGSVVRLVWGYSLWRISIPPILETLSGMAYLNEKSSSRSGTKIWSLGLMLWIQ